MKKVDTSFAILTDNAVWTEIIDIPVNDYLITTFKVTQNFTSRRNPVIIMYFKSESKQSINPIKYHPTFWTHLNSSNVYMYPDLFQN